MIPGESVAFLSALEIAARVGAGALTATAVTEAILSRIQALNPTLNAFTTILPDRALEQAGRVDARVRAGMAPGPLAGVPVAIKDLADLAGVPTTCGGHPAFHRTPDRTASVIQRLVDAGAVVVGKTNLHEFAYGVTNVNPHFGPVRNPWQPARIPGGSSGGSAAALAAGLAAGALGTDTGGSIRIPGALCGVVGLKPTYGLVPVDGITPLSWTLDHAGPMTRTVADATVMLALMAGREPPGPPRPDLDGIRVGVPRQFFWDRLDDEVASVGHAAVDTLRRCGAALRSLEVPHADMAGPAVAIIISAEATATHEARLRSRRTAFGEDVRVRLERGFFVPATDYLYALRARTYLTRLFTAMFADVDVLVMPATSTAATPMDDDSASAAETSLAMSARLTRNTNPFNLTGLPALSVPCGFTRGELPVGLQIVGRPFDDATVLRVGEAYERATDWHLRQPPLGNGETR